MWTLLATSGLLIAVAFAEPSYKVGSQYKYEVNIKTLTSLFQVTNQNSGVFIRAELTVTPVKEDELICFISEPRIAEIHATFPETVDFDFSQISVNYKPLNLSKEFFVIKQKEGIVDELLVSRRLPIWEVNIIRSIVSQFQVDTKGKRIIPSRLNSIPKRDGNAAVFKIMEDTVEGECEVLYDINPIPKYTLKEFPFLSPLFELEEESQMFEVMKTKNFSNCEQRPGYHFGITGLTDWEPTVNRMGTFLTRSSVSRVIISGSFDTYTMQSSVTTNRVILSPTITEHQKGNVIARVEVILTSLQPSFKTLQRPKNFQPLKKLVYDFNSPFIEDREARDKWDKREKHTVCKSLSCTFTNDREVLERLDGRKEQTINKSIWPSGSVSKHFLNKRYIDDKTLVLYNEGWYQEMPKITQAPSTPFFPYFVGFHGHSLHHAKEINLSKEVKQLVEEIGLQLQEQTQAYKQNILENFLILTSLLRTMNLKQLEHCVQEIYFPEQKNALEDFQPRRNAWMAFRDALAQAGTGPALLTIVNLITSHRIGGEEAAQVVSTLPETVRYPTNEYLSTFFELVKNTDVVSRSSLNVSCIYAFTELIRMAQVNLKTAHNRYPVHAFGYFASQDDETVSNVFIPYFAMHLEKAVTEKESHKIQTYIMALGNIAHSKIVQVFKPYLEGKKPMTDFQRTVVVISLNKLAVVHPRLARSVLYKIYANAGEAYQVRVAAVFTLMKANPSGNMLQRMAQFTHVDPSYQVRSAVKSAIESAAQLSSDLNNELRKNAESAVSLLVPTIFDDHYSRLNLTDHLFSDLFFDLTQILECIGSEDSSAPKLIAFNVLGVQSGLKHTIYKVSGMVSSVQKVLDLLQVISVSDNKKKTLESSNAEGYNFTIDNIFKILNIESIMPKQVEGNAFFEFGTMQRFFTFDSRNFESLAQIIKKTTGILSKGKICNYQKLMSDFEICIGLPLATGLPFTYTLKTPTYVGVKGNIKIEVSETQKAQNVFHDLGAIQLSANVDATFAKTKLGEIGFVTPFNHRHYLAGYKKQFQINLPVKGKFFLNTTKNFIEIKVKSDKKSGDYKFVHYSTKPFTAIQNVIDFKPILKTDGSKIMMTAPSKDSIKNYGSRNLGMVFRLQGQAESSFIRLRDVISLAYFPTTHNKIENSELGLYYDDKMSTAQAVILTASYRHIKAQENFQYENGTKNQESQSRIKKFYQRAFTETNQTVLSAIDINLKVHRDKLIEYDGAFAIVDNETVPIALLAYIHQTVHDENYEVCIYGNIEDTSNVSDYVNLLQAEPKLNVTFTLLFGEKCEKGEKINLSGKLERSEQRREYLKTLPQILKCRSDIEGGSKFMTACKSAAVAASIMDKYKLIIQYDGVSGSVENMTNLGFSIICQMGHPCISENRTFLNESRSNKLQMDGNLSIDLKTASALLTTSTGTTFFSNIPVCKLVRKLLIMQSITTVFRKLGSSSFQRVYDGSCSINKTHAKTFNDQTYSLRLGSVWHVMSISLLELNSTNFNHFSVLVKDTFSNHKEVQFSLGYPKSTLVRITPGDGNQPNLFINNNLIHFNESGFYEFLDPLTHFVTQAYSVTTGEIKITHTGLDFEFKYHQNNVQLVLSEKYRNRVGGLCGVFDTEHFDYVTPRGYILHDSDEFVATWALSDEGHIRELKKKAQQHSKYKKITEFTNVVGEQDTGKADTLGRYHEDLSQDYDPYSLGSEESPEQNSQCVTKRIMVVERDGKHCFSVNPQTACKTGCQVEKTRRMNADFICMNKSQTSSHWAHMVARGAQPNLKKKGNAQKIQFEGPEICSKILVV